MRPGRRTSKCATCGAVFMTELADDQQTFDAHLHFKLNHYVMHTFAEKATTTT